MTDASQRAARKIESIDVDLIDVPDGRRPVRDDDVRRLAESMKAVGLRTPITVRYFPDRPSNGTDDSFVLTVGAHRLAAAKLLGWTRIDCWVVDLDDVGAEMWEISENLHRADLTALERSDQIGRWAELLAAKGAQVAPPGGSQPRDMGIKKAARELGIGRDDASRAVKVAALAPEAKQAARDAGLDDNRTALLQAARETSPRRQAAAIRKIAKARARPARPAVTPAPGRGPEAVCERVREALRVLAGLPPAHEVGRYFAGTDAAVLVDETVGPARAWLNEFADTWTASEDAA